MPNLKHSMRNILATLCGAALLLAGSDSLSFDLGDVLKEVDKQTRPQKQPAPQPQPPATPTAPQPPAVPAPQQPATPLDLLEKSLGGKNSQGSKILGAAVGTVQAMQPIAYEEEKTIGGALATEVFSRFGGPYPNMQLQKYVTLVGQSVARLSDRADIPYHFAILNTEEPNAFATPGGYVFVSRGLLRLVDNEAQLAGVLGHEIAHVTQKHALQTIQRSKTIQGVTALSMAVMDKNPEKFSQLINEVSDVLFTQGLDQKLEFEADQLGMEFAVRTGYPPSGLQDFIRALAGATRSHSIFFSTHPAPRDRYARLNALMGQYADAMKNAALGQRYKAAVQGQL